MNYEHTINVISCNDSVSMEKILYLVISYDDSLGYKRKSYATWYCLIFHTHTDAQTDASSEMTGSSTDL